MSKLKLHPISLLVLAALHGVAMAQVDPVERYLDSAEKRALNVAREAGAQGRGIAMEASQGVLAAIALFRSQYGDALKQTSEELTKERAALFRDIRNSTEALGAETAAATAALQKTADTLSATVANLPLGKDVPRLTSVKSLFSVAGDDSARFVVSGMFLTHGTPKLLLQGESRAPVNALDTELQFSAPVLPSELDKPTLVSGKLEIYERKDFLWLFDRYQTKTLPVQMAVYPKLIGSASITPLVSSQRTETVSRTSASIRCDSPRGDGHNATGASISASPGFSIVAGSQKFNVEYANHGNFTFSSQSPASFIVTLGCDGWGKNMFDAGQNGVIVGTVSWQETRTYDVVEKGAPISFPFSWNDSRVDVWPPNTVSVVFAVEPTFKPGRLELEGAGRMKFATLEFNPATKTTLLSARRINEALGEP